MNPSLAILTMVVLPALQGVSQDAKSVLETVAAKQAERWASVQNYAVEQTWEGAAMPVPVYYEKTVVNGNPTFRAVPLNEWAKQAAGTSQMKPEDSEDRLAAEAGARA